MNTASQKGKVLGAGSRLGERYLAAGNAVFVWDELKHSKRSSLQSRTMSYNDRRHYFAGNIRVIDGGPIVGSVRFTEIPFERPWKTVLVISHFRSKEEYQREGIGKHLLEKAIEFARQNKRIRAVELSVESNNTGATELYMKMGFVKVSEPLFEVGKKEGLSFMHMKIRN